VRIFAAIVYLAVLAAMIWLELADEETVGTWLIVLVPPIACGLIAGRWWVVLLCLAPLPLVLANPDVNTTDLTRVAFAVIWVVLQGAGLVAGVLVAKGVRLARERARTRPT